MELLPILELCKDLGNLPLFHIATDMDLKMREVGHKRCHVKVSPFHAVC